MSATLKVAIVEDQVALKWVLRVWPSMIGEVHQIVDRHVLEDRGYPVLERLKVVLIEGPLNVVREGAAWCSRIRNCLTCTHETKVSEVVP